MKVKVKSYDLKNSAAPGNKSKTFKANNSKFNAKSKKVGGVIDKRKYINDTTLSEADQLSRRIALENMNRKSGYTNSQSENSLFSTVADDNDTWYNDPFFLKTKQVSQFDEGLDESSEDENRDVNTEDYFAKKLVSDKKKKKTLDEIIRDSKIEKYEKFKANDKDAEITTKVNENFRDKIRHILPTLGSAAKSISNNKYDIKNDISTNFETFFGSLHDSKRPPKADGKSIKNIENKKKDNEKNVNLKLKRLRDNMAKDGITKDGDSENEDGFGGENLDDSQEEDSENGDSCEESEDCDEESNNEEDEEESEEDSDEIDEDEVENESDNNDNKIEENEVVLSGDSTEAFKNLKKIISQTSKSTKRKLEDTEHDSIKRRKIVDNNKNEIDCFRVILKMPDLHNDIMLVLANEMTTNNITNKEDYVRKLVLATLFQESLKSDKPNSYSPELLGLINFFLESSTEESLSWLSLKCNLSDMSPSDLLDICSTDDVIIGRHIISIIFHISNLLISILECNKHLFNKHSLFLPMLDIIKRLPTKFYPSWLTDKLEQIVEMIESINKETVPQLCMKKVYKIIELLEPDLNDKYDKDKNITKVLKDKIKKEKKSAMKEMKLVSKFKIRDEVSQAKKDKQMRIKKTNEIIHGINQR